MIKINDKNGTFTFYKQAKLYFMMAVFILQKFCH